MLKTILPLVVAVFLISNQSQAWDQYDEEALQKTIQLLKNKTERENSIKGDEEAGKADAYTKNLFGGDSKSTNAVYELAADVFADLAKQADGDADKMKALIEQFQRDPAAFADKWSPEQKKRLKEISTKVKVPASNP